MKDESAMLSIANYAAGFVGEFGTQELSNLTWGMATLNVLSEVWMEASGAEIAKRSTECCPQDLSNTIWAYGTLLHKRNEHLRAINWEVMRQIEFFSPQGLANVVWGLSAIEYRDQKVLTCISEEVIRRPMEQLTPPDISTLLYSFAVHSWLHEGALAKLRRCVRYALPVFATRDVANVSWAMVILSHRDDGIFQRLMARSMDMMQDFSVQGLCNIAWAFVRFGLKVPVPVAQGIAEETVKRREELSEAPGDAILLSDAVCSEWFDHVPRQLLDQCDAIGREQYDKVFGFLSNFSNIPSIGSPAADVELYQHRVVGFEVIQLGHRLSLELLRRLDMLEDSTEAIRELRGPREKWLWDELQTVDPTDASLQHKTTCGWSLRFPGCVDDGVQILTSGSPMNAEVRFVSCNVEHLRASDAEFQVVNKSADQLLARNCCSGTLRLDVSEIPCLSCLGAMRQFQKAFPEVRLRFSFSIRKVSDVCVDKSGDASDSVAHCPPPRSYLDPVPPGVPDNRGRGRSAPPSSQALRTPGARVARAVAPLNGAGSVRINGAAPGDCRTTPPSPISVPKTKELSSPSPEVAPSGLGLPSTTPSPSPLRMETDTSPMTGELVATTQLVAARPAAPGRQSFY